MLVSPLEQTECLHYNTYLPCMFIGLLMLHQKKNKPGKRNAEHCNNVKITATDTRAYISNMPSCLDRLDRDEVKEVPASRIWRKAPIWYRFLVDVTNGLQLKFLKKRLIT
jgi:hypothetical protein